MVIPMEMEVIHTTILHKNITQLIDRIWRYSFMHNVVSFVLITFLVTMMPVIAVAGAGHEHGHSHEAITGKEAHNKAVQKMQELATAGKIDASWSEVKMGSISQKDYGHGPEWVVLFKNDKVKDASKQTLYLFFSQDGHYIAANYDGS